MGTFYTKPNGMRLEVHELSREYVESLGWAEDQIEGPPTLDRRGLPWDDRLNQKNMAMTEHGNWKYRQGMTAELAVEIETELLDSLIG